MDSEPIYLAWNGDAVGRKVTEALLRDEPEEAARAAYVTKRGNALLEALAVAHGGTVVESSGDRGCVTVGADHLGDLPGVMAAYEDLVGGTLSVGVGATASEAAKACAAAKRRGGDQVVLWTPEIEAELREAPEGDNPDDVVKAEPLEKAIGDIPKGRRVYPGPHQIWPEREQRYNYSHLLSPAHRKAGYGLALTQMGNNFPNDNLVNVGITHQGNDVGWVSGVVSPEPKSPRAMAAHLSEASLDEEHQGKGLGLAAHEAFLAHARNHLGALAVIGGAVSEGGHTSAAAGVQQALARKHGLDYRQPKEVPGASDTYGDGKYGEFAYMLRSEVNKAEPTLTAVPPAPDTTDGANGQPAQPAPSPGDDDLADELLPDCVGDTHLDGCRHHAAYTVGTPDALTLAIANAVPLDVSSTPPPHAGPTLEDRVRETVGRQLAQRQAQAAGEQRDGDGVRARLAAVLGKLQAQPEALAQLVRANPGVADVLRDLIASVREMAAATPHSVVAKAEDASLEKVDAEYLGHATANTPDDHLPDAMRQKGWRLQVHGPDEDGHVTVHAHHPHAGKQGYLNGTIKGDRLKLFDTQVHPGWRGNGVGTAMFRALYDHAIRRGVTGADVPEHSTQASHVLARIHDDYRPSLQPDAGPRVGAYDYRMAPTRVTLATKRPPGPLEIPPDETVKSEPLEKALADVGPGKPLPGASNPSGKPGVRSRFAYDYSHHLSPEHRAAGLTLQVHHGWWNGYEPGAPKTQEHVEAQLHQGGGQVGKVYGFITAPRPAHSDVATQETHDERPVQIHPHSELVEELHGQGLGRKMYEAAFAHAMYASGAKEASGGFKSGDAHHVHQSLARRHGLDYQTAGKNAGYRYALKAEVTEGPLVKAVGKIRVGTVVPDSRFDYDNGTHEQEYDYSHVLPVAHRKAGYSMAVIHTIPKDPVAGRKEYGQEKMQAWLSHNGKSVGHVDGFVKPAQRHQAGAAIEPHSRLEPEHRGKGLGSAMYEALYAHAYKAGVRQVEGGQHSEDASAVHQRLAAKHGFAYRPNYDAYTEDDEQAPSDELVGPYSYALKSEGAADEENRLIGPGRGVVFARGEPLQKAVGGAIKGRQHVMHPVGTTIEPGGPSTGRVKVTHQDSGGHPESVGWISARAGMIRSNDRSGHPVSARHPTEAGRDELRIG